jgi:hypothetical protein
MDWEETFKFAYEEINHLIGSEEIEDDFDRGFVTGLEIARRIMEFYLPKEDEKPN